MRIINVAIVNGISLQVVADDREQLVAVKPVCEILGVDYPGQVAKLKEHPIYGSTALLSKVVDADGKEGDMVCIPFRVFAGWVFSINPDDVREEMREHLLEHQKKCNDILHDYFFSRVDFSKKKDRAVSTAKYVFDKKLEQLRIAKSELKVAENELSKTLAMTFEEWQANCQQLRIPGFD